jgi:hypothetical protein
LAHVQFEGQGEATETDKLLGLAELRGGVGENMHVSGMKVQQMEMQAVEEDGVT